MEFEDLVLEFDEILEGHARKEYCENKTGGVKRGKDSRLSCSCLHILRDHNLRDPVARFMARNVHHEKREIDEQLLDWYRYSKMQQRRCKTDTTFHMMGVLLMMPGKTYQCFGLQRYARLQCTL